jgi:TolB-like protein
MAHTYIWFFVALLLLASCATTRNGGDGSDDLEKLQRQLQFRPDDPAALRDVGVIYFQRKQYPLAKERLARSFAQVADDPRTMFYYGMTLEFLNDTTAALAAYINYTELSPLSQFKKLIEGRFRTLTQAVVKSQVRAALAAEAALGADSLSRSAVAVFPLKYQGSDPKYQVLGKGLAEMILVDLAQVKSLNVVERIRIEALMNELKFAQSENVDKASAPRVGKLLSAGKVVTGTFNVFGWNLRMDVAAWDVVAKKFPELKTESDELDKLFRIEKQIVFKILTDLGITPTPQEQQAIMSTPTRNVLAFMTYCLGLRSEDAFDFKAARVYYNQAAGVDPNFNLAKTKATTAEGMVLAGGPKENALSAAEAIDPALKSSKKKGRLNLLTQRLSNLESSLGSSFRPGQDDRKPAEEVLESGVLPEPPPPPQGR